MTTTGIEPLFWLHTSDVILPMVQSGSTNMSLTPQQTNSLKYGLDPSKIDTAYGLARGYEKLNRFKADIQITLICQSHLSINLPSLGN